MRVPKRRPDPDLWGREPPVALSRRRFFQHEAQAPGRSSDRAGDRGGGDHGSGIVLPDTAKEKPQKGKVLAVGDGKLDDDGKRIPLDVKKGDEVLYSKYGGTEIKVDGEDLLVLRESDVLARVES